MAGIEQARTVTSKRAFLTLWGVLSLLLAAAPAGASDPAESGGGAAASPAVEQPVVPAPPAEAAQTETTPTTPGGEEQPTDTETTPNGGTGPVGELPENGAAGESAGGGLPRTGLEVAAMAMIGLGLLMAGLALRPTSSWPPPRDRLSRSIRPR